MKKRVSFLLAILLLLLAFLPGASATEISVFSVEATTGVNYDGYLVTVRDNLSPRIIPLDAGVAQIRDTLFLVDAMEEAEAIWAAHEVLFIEPNYEIELFSTPNDTLFPRQWDMHMINATALWDAGITGRGARVAIIDSGIRRDHDDFNQTFIERGFNYITNTTAVLDTDGHGTGVTGVIAAVRNNRFGMAGLVDQATIIPLQVFEGRTTNLNLAIAAVYDAVDVFDADVINMSWGIIGGGASQALEIAINHATSRNVIVVAAVGNSGTTAYSFPAAFSNVIGVGAVDYTGTVAGFSQRNTSVFVTAPGVDVITVGIRDRYTFMYDTGTSIAAPFVTAMAAAARSMNPDITVAQFRTALQNSAVTIGGGYNTSYGHGIIDMERFLAQLPCTGEFTDVPGHWAQDSIRFVVNYGLFEGITPSTFAPNAPMNRAMFVTVLGRLYTRMGNSIPSRNDNFIDTVNGSWYSRYVAWAAENGIVSGVGGNRFAPNQTVSRQEAATILQNFTRHTGRAAVGNPVRLNPFIDRATVAEWGRLPLAWAIEQGIIAGVSTSNGLALQPNGPSTRAQIAVILQRYVQSQNITLRSLELDPAA